MAGPGAPGQLGGRAAPLWGQLRAILASLSAGAAPVSGDGADGADNGCVGALLRDAAGDAVLGADPRMELPQWLADMFMVRGGGLGVTACG